MSPAEVLILSAVLQLRNDANEVAKGADFPSEAARLLFMRFFKIDPAPAGADRPFVVQPTQRFLDLLAALPAGGDERHSVESGARAEQGKDLRRRYAEAGKAVEGISVHGAPVPVAASVSDGKREWGPEVVPELWVALGKAIERCGNDPMKLAELKGFIMGAGKALLAPGGGS